MWFILCFIKFVLSDFFHGKTSIRTFYIMDGKKKCMDNVNLICSMLYLIFFQCLREYYYITF